MGGGSYILDFTTLQFIDFDATVYYYLTFKIRHLGCLLYNINLGLVVITIFEGYGEGFWFKFISLYLNQYNFVHLNKGSIWRYRHRVNGSNSTLLTHFEKKLIIYMYLFICKKQIQDQIYDHKKYYSSKCLEFHEFFLMVKVIF